MDKSDSRGVEGIPWLQFTDGYQPSPIKESLLVTRSPAKLQWRTASHETLHFVDNNTLVPWGSDGHDRLGKVRPLIDHLSEKLAKVYEPDRDIVVDEAMIKFQGRSSLKPTTCGIKVWVAADSSNGYLSIHGGKTQGSV